MEIFIISLVYVLSLMIIFGVESSLHSRGLGSSVLGIIIECAFAPLFGFFYIGSFIGAKI